MNGNNSNGVKHANGSTNGTKTAKPLSSTRMPAGYVVKHELIRWVRGPLLATFATVFLTPVFYQLAEIWVQRWGYSDRSMFIAMTATLHAILYFGLNGAFYLCDNMKWLSQYKIARTPVQIPSAALVRKTVREALLSQIFVGPVVMYFWYGLLKRMGTPDALEPILPQSPEFTNLATLISSGSWNASSALTACAQTIFSFSFLRLYFCFWLCVILNEGGFYWAHRLLHTSDYLYEKVHKQHHNYKGSIGFAAEYAAPFEQVLANQIPTIAACTLLGVHPLIWYVWMVWRLEETYEAHSGYCFRGTFLDRIGLLHASAAEYHDFHHTVNKGNYGNMFWDWIGNTQEFWVAKHSDKSYD